MEPAQKSAVLYLLTQVKLFSSPSVIFVADPVATTPVILRRTAQGKHLTA
jgi:hypothetical protein